MVINVLTLFQFQNLQNPNANSKARPKQVKKNTFIRNTAKMRKRKNTEQFVSSVWQVFSFSAKSINQSIPASLTLFKTLDMCKCLTALPAWGTAAEATLSSLAPSHHPYSEIWVYVLFPAHLGCFEVTIYGTTDQGILAQCCRYFCRRLFRDLSQTLQKQLCFSKLFHQCIFYMLGLK